MKRAILACMAALTLCAGCLFEDIGFEDCECDDTYFSPPAGH